MNSWEHTFIQSHRVARLATKTPAGAPHVLPVVYAYDGQHLFTPLDAKPKQVELRKLQRVRNIAADERVALVIDDYAEDWAQLAWVQIRGRAALHTEGTLYDTGIALLAAKYPQYATMPLVGRPLFVIHIEKITGWRADRA